MKDSKRKNNKKSKLPVPNVDMKKKQDIELIRSNIEKLSEDEIRNLFLLIEAENRELRKIYYSDNTQIMLTRQRTFKELTKKFVKNVDNYIEVWLGKKIAKYRNYF